MIDVFSLMLWGALLMLIVAVFLPGRRMPSVTERAPQQEMFAEQAASA